MALFDLFFKQTAVPTQTPESNNIPTPTETPKSTETATPTVVSVVANTSEHDENARLRHLGYI